MIDKRLEWAIRAALADLSLAADAEIGESSKTLVELFDAAKEAGIEVEDYSDDVEHYRE